MPAEASLQELQLVYSSIQSIRSVYPEFYFEWLSLLYKADRYNIPFGYICQYVRDVEIHDRYINKIYNQNLLAKIHQDLSCLKTKHYEAYLHLSNFLDKNYWYGYNNICRMMLGETPEDLKRGNCG